MASRVAGLADLCVAEIVAVDTADALVEFGPGAIGAPWPAGNAHLRPRLEGPPRKAALAGLFGAVGAARGAEID